MMTILAKQDALQGDPTGSGGESIVPGPATRHGPNGAVLCDPDSWTRPGHTLSLAQRAPDGTPLYLRDDPDGCHPRASADPFLARPFPDLAAVDAYLAANPKVDRPGVQVVPWPIDLDRAAYVGATSESMPAAMSVAAPVRPSRRRPATDLMEAFR